MLLLADTAPTTNDLELSSDHPTVNINDVNIAQQAYCWHNLYNSQYAFTKFVCDTAGAARQRSAIQPHRNGQWFRTYKVPRGDGTLTIAGENHQNATFTSSIAESHEWWQELVAGEVDSNEINYNQTSSTEYNNSYVEPGTAWDELEIPRWSTYGQAAQKPERYNGWYYLDDNEELIVLRGDYSPSEEN
ncbi:hypothetical protein CBER1_10828 [Cercospora berteroae]|uniref:Uncharacterized protein n=1 Tax=Cercospora berteroae TaxID=357750 RepID=A0A2S6BYY8_9PEZI|nr:hypothetical protein CBER1_10828 [Cercospora berteroae]